jgi:hypothetical protein
LVSAASAACWSGRGRIGDRQEIGLFAHDLSQATPSTDFVVPAGAPRRAADAYGADELVAIDDNRQPTTLGEIAE